MTEAIQKGYKQTEIGVIPEDWEIKVLGNFANIKTGEKNGNEEVIAGKYPFFVRSQKIKKIDTYSFDGEAILIPGEGGIGTIIHYIKGKFDYHQRVYKISNFGRDNSAKFIYYIMIQNFDKHATKNSVKATVDSLRLPTFLEFKFPAPRDKEEQSTIAQVLSETDELIQQLNKLISKKKNIKKGVMQELLTGNKRLSGFSGEWEVKKLGDIVDFLKGSGLSKTKISIDGNKKCILYGELFTTYNEVITTVISKTNYSEGIFSKSGDILMPGSTTTVGIDLAVASALLEDNVYLGGDINILRKKGDSYNSEFLANYITHVMKNKIAEITQGTTIIHLYGRNLKDLSLIIPKSLEEQSAIAKILSDIDSDIEELEQKRNKYQMIKKGMMQQLLTGRIRLKWKK